MAHHLGATAACAGAAAVFSGRARAADELGNRCRHRPALRGDDSARLAGHAHHTHFGAAGRTGTGRPAAGPAGGQSGAGEPRRVAHPALYSGGRADRAGRAGSAAGARYREILGPARPRGDRPWVSRRLRAAARLATLRGAGNLRGRRGSAARRRDAPPARWRRRPRARLGRGHLRSARALAHAPDVSRPDRHRACGAGQRRRPAGRRRPLRARRVVELLDVGQRPARRHPGHQHSARRASGGPARRQRRGPARGGSGARTARRRHRPGRGRRGPRAVAPALRGSDDRPASGRGRRCPGPGDGGGALAGLHLALSRHHPEFSRPERDSGAQADAARPARRDGVAIAGPGRVRRPSAHASFALHLTIARPPVRHTGAQ
ncbi:adenine deaminase-related protein [Deinococcus radiodurans R1 = ATCC 13939 = DSM 20539]|uniref:Adenine deaminase-related protein n=1 Tax=Deinococcus radiodurans (strain ATCC 13939 / DSM 20539 / JCM 16871 / CCUG 27074 / LMG 4051 / NBRC 15346 / NCIMB 9279 / VKM B-1422 / R1) TaxID=243230 RepID=Q9RYP2_DEIRA|nr:adenine deaminase-related protein [Deinococcus radiodurans R1 = ATCC 13939 = DSM 20539]